MIFTHEERRIGKMWLPLLSLLLLVLIAQTCAPAETQKPGPYGCTVADWPLKGPFKDCDAEVINT